MNDPRVFNAPQLPGKAYNLNGRPLPEKTDVNYMAGDYIMPQLPVIKTGHKRAESMPMYHEGTINSRWTSAPKRLAMLRYNAAVLTYVRTMTPPFNWRGVRYRKLNSGDSGWHGGLNTAPNGRDKLPVHVTFEVPTLRTMWVDKVEDAYIKHQGWFTSPDGDTGVLRGFILRLPHGKLVPGYCSTDNGEWVLYTNDIYDDERECARAADHYAQHTAEVERDYRQHWNEAHEIDGEINEALEEIAKAFALRNHKRFGPEARKGIVELAGKVRGWRETLATDYKDVEL